ncbi:Sulfide dehydrogenase [flavocytochrome c] flavoprotein chain [Magnetospirillum gryphiswaldense MSR-1 v2]|uniref:Sulfide dehydrogenase [flavocytochrome c] flavoprotein chain n=1 Tax=Magnetospirillum gryphiswaldense (strain DSM 6361 / JCM 21280 / NBRC 15271 / MSR-1) TaxID=431944 RepID=V6EZ40_MAGGM|nr:NAD(P)/FAD-dependent oxidoreductase [Magnetospirillum gryphiswaldense]CDK98474.1 Sulfide dehydrogenase [flavocytochrome c] flavoprotein chain [Magnetospirillum gryphiswaldense MSR-1 v2]
MTTRLSRRSFGLLAGAAALTGLSACAARPPAKARVVVIGGGFGGATTAKYIRRLDPAIDVTLVERSKSFVTCPFSNAVIGGLQDISTITHSYDALSERWGVDVIHDEAIAVDTVKKIVALKGGRQLSYDKLVVAPGIDFKWNAIEGYDEKAAEILPHAWKAGAQTITLRRQLEALEDGGVVALSVPANPYRCPPGPYERASLIAHYLKTTKPKSKLLILDGKDSFSKQGLFQDAWAKMYPGLIEWVPLSKDGKITKVDAAARVLESEFGTKHKVAVANVIPPQQAGAIAHVAGLVDKSGWVPVDAKTFEAKQAKDVYVVGDATIAAPQPKSGFIANAHGKVVAATIVNAVNGKGQLEPSWANTCYSLIAPDYGITVAGVYRVGDKGLEEVPGSGGVSPKDADAQFRALEARYARDWYKSITTDTWG